MKRGRTMTMIRVAISDATLKWVDEIRKDIEELTGHRPPPRASVLSVLLEAVRQDDGRWDAYALDQSIATTGRRIRTVKYTYKPGDEIPQPISAVLGGNLRQNAEPPKNKPDKQPLPTLSDEQERLVAEIKRHHLRLHLTSMYTRQPPRSVFSTWYPAARMAALLSCQHRQKFASG